MMCKKVMIYHLLHIEFAMSISLRIFTRHSVNFGKLYYKFKQYNRKWDFFSVKCRNCNCNLLLTEITCNDGEGYIV